MSEGPGIDPAVALGQIEAADPSFNLELFKRHAVETYMAVKQAVADRDLTPVAEGLSDSVYEDLRDHVASLLDRGATGVDGPMVPSAIRVAAAERGPQGDAITMRIGAAPIQFVASTGHAVDGGPDLSLSSTEFWTFSRPPEPGTALPRRPECPICGAPVDINTGRICRYCKTLLPSPRAQTGWVVAAIRPAQENAG